MTIECMNGKFRTIFTESVIARIRLLTALDGVVVMIILDVHGLTCKEAKRLINNVINITKGCCVVEIIHGYRHGTKLKEMIRVYLLNPYIRWIVEDPRNPGVTYLKPA